MLPVYSATDSERQVTTMSCQAMHSSYKHFLSSSCVLDPGEKGKPYLFSWSTQPAQEAAPEGFAFPGLPLYTCFPFVIPTHSLESPLLSGVQIPCL